MHSRAARWSTKSNRNRWRGSASGSGACRGAPPRRAIHGLVSDENELVGDEQLDSFGHNSSRSTDGSAEGEQALSSATRSTTGTMSRGEFSLSQGGGGDGYSLIPVRGGAPQGWR